MTRHHAIAATLFLTTLAASAQGTRQWTTTRYEEFERGTPTGIALRNDGRLEPAPALRTVASTPATLLWSIASAGPNLYTGTGSISGGSQLLKVDSKGATTVAASFKELNVQAILPLPNGDILAATSPSGKVYRITAAQLAAPQPPTPNQQNLSSRPGRSEVEGPAANSAPATNLTSGTDQKNSSSGSEPQGTATAAPATNYEVVFDPAITAEKPRYLWSLALAKDGDLLIAAGAPATIYKLPLTKPTPQPKPWFRSGDQHIRTLLVAPDGTLYAGSDGAGILYRITPDGKPFAFYAAPRHEITALALDPSGNLYAAAVGDRRNPTLPSLNVATGAAPAGAAALGAAIIAIGPPATQPVAAAALLGNTAVPDGSELYRITPDGTPTRLVALREDVVYALSWRNNALIAGSGNRGRVYRLDPADPGAYTDIAHTESGQVTAIAATPSGLALATANSGKLLLLSDVTASNSTYISDVFDAATTTAWGRAEVTGTTNGIDLFVRSGNIENPRDAFAHLWSDWVAVKPNQTPLPAPASRYLQWKAVLHPNTQLSAVTVNYLPRNLPPQIDDLIVQPGARATNTTGAPTPNTSVTISFRSAPTSPAAPPSAESGAAPLIAQRDRTAVTAHWAAHDPNNDPLTYTLDYRGVRETAWRPLRRDIRGTSYSFDASLLPDGEYELRITATDAASHNAADALTAQRISPPFTVDTTPPVPGPLTATVRNGQLHATLDATDATTPIAHAEYSLDGQPWQYLEPAGHLSDSLTEHYDLTLPVTGTEPHTLAIRVYDREENAASIKTTAAQ